MSTNRFGKLLEKSNINLGETMKKIESQNEGVNYLIVEVEKIIPSKNNSYDQLALNDVKESIRKRGLFHNLVLCPYIDSETNERLYELLSGETRYRAIKELISEGDQRFVKGIPSIVISEETSEIDKKIIIEEANIKQRQYSPKLMRESVDRLTQLYKEKAETTGEKINVGELVAENLDINKRTVHRYNAINKLIPELKELFDKEKIKVRNVDNFSKLDEEEQKAIYELLKDQEKISKEEIEIYKEQIKTKEIEHSEEISKLLKEFESKKHEHEIEKENNNKKLENLERDYLHLVEQEESLKEQLQKAKNEPIIDDDKIKELQDKLNNVELMADSIEQEKEDLLEEKKNLELRLKELEEKYKKQEKEKEELLKKSAEVSLTEEEKERLKNEYELQRLVSDISKNIASLKSIKEKMSLKPGDKEYNNIKDSVQKAIKELETLS